MSGKLVHIWMCFLEIDLCHGSEFFEYHFSTKCSILDEFPEIGLCHAAWLMPQNSKSDDWMSFPEIGQAHAPEFANKC